MLALGLSLGLLSLRLLPLVLALPRLGWLGRALLLLLAEGFVVSQNLDLLPQLAPQADPLQLAFPLVHELAAGLALFLLFAIFWGVLQAAGQLVGLSSEPEQHGLFFPADHDALSTTQLSLAPLLGLCGTALFFALDGPSHLLGVLAHSYVLIPLPGRDHEPSPWHLAPEHVAALGGRLFALTLLCTLPVLLPRLLAELWLALATRSLLGPRSGTTADVERLAPLRPLLFLLTALLGGSAVLMLWLRQGPELFRLFLAPLGLP